MYQSFLRAELVRSIQETTWHELVYALHLLLGFFFSQRLVIFILLILAERFDQIFQGGINIRDGCGCQDLKAQTCKQVTRLQRLLVLQL